MRLTSCVYQLHRLGGVGIWGANVFLLADKRLTLVDTGFRGRYVHILKQLKRLGYTPNDVDNIILTHHHADHAGSVAALKEITKAKVFAHSNDAPYIEGRLPQPGPIRPEWLGDTLKPFSNMWATEPAAVDRLVNDGDELPILGGLQILHTPGHTPGSISLFIPREAMLIIGDVLSNTLGLSLPSKAFTVDIEPEIASIKRLARLEFNIVCFGHGFPLRRKARSAISDFTRTINKNTLDYY